jgi:hypothetical protein
VDILWGEITDQRNFTQRKRRKERGATNARIRESGFLQKVTKGNNSQKGCILLAFA